jgi:hypothetical protein
VPILPTALLAVLFVGNIVNKKVTSTRSTIRLRVKAAKQGAVAVQYKYVLGVSHGYFSIEAQRIKLQSRVQSQVAS